MADEEVHQEGESISTIKKPVPRTTPKKMELIPEASRSRSLEPKASNMVATAKKVEPKASNTVATARSLEPKAINNAARCRGPLSSRSLLYSIYSEGYPIADALQSSSTSTRGLSKDSSATTSYCYSGSEGVENVLLPELNAQTLEPGTSAMVNSTFSGSSASSDLSSGLGNPMRKLIQQKYEGGKTPSNKVGNSSGWDFDARDNVLVVAPNKSSMSSATDFSSFSSASSGKTPESSSLLGEIQEQLPSSFGSSTASYPSSGSSTVQTGTRKIDKDPNTSTRKKASSFGERYEKALSTGIASSSSSSDSRCPRNIVSLEFDSSSASTEVQLLSHSSSSDGRLDELHVISLSVSGKEQDKIPQNADKQNWDRKTVSSKSIAAKQAVQSSPSRIKGPFQSLRKSLSKGMSSRKKHIVAPAVIDSDEELSKKKKKSDDDGLDVRSNPSREAYAKTQLKIPSIKKNNTSPEKRSSRRQQRSKRSPPRRIPGKDIDTDNAIEQPLKKYSNILQGIRMEDNPSILLPPGVLKNYATEKNLKESNSEGFLSTTDRKSRQQKEQQKSSRKHRKKKKRFEPMSQAQQTVILEEIEKTISNISYETTEDVALTQQIEQYDGVDLELENVAAAANTGAANTGADTNPQIEGKQTLTKSTEKKVSPSKESGHATTDNHKAYMLNTTKLRVVGERLAPIGSDTGKAIDSEPLRSSDEGKRKESKNSSSGKFISHEESIEVKKSVRSLKSESLSSPKLKSAERTESVKPKAMKESSKRQRNKLRFPRKPKMFGSKSKPLGALQEDPTISTKEAELAPSCEKEQTSIPVAVSLSIEEQKNELSNDGPMNEARVEGETQTVLETLSTDFWTKRERFTATIASTTKAGFEFVEVCQQEFESATTLPQQLDCSSSCFDCNLPTGIEAVLSSCTAPQNKETAAEPKDLESKQDANETKAEASNKEANEKAKELETEQVTNELKQLVFNRDANERAKQLSANQDAAESNKFQSNQDANETNVGLDLVDISQPPQLCTNDCCYEYDLSAGIEAVIGGLATYGGLATSANERNKNRNEKIESQQEKKQSKGDSSAMMEPQGDAEILSLQRVRFPDVELPLGCNDHICFDYGEDRGETLELQQQHTKGNASEAVESQKDAGLLSLHHAGFPIVELPLDCNDYVCFDYGSTLRENLPCRNMLESNQDLETERQTAKKNTDPKESVGIEILKKVNTSIEVEQSELGDASSSASGKRSWWNFGLKSSKKGKDIVIEDPPMNNSSNQVAVATTQEMTSSDATRSTTEEEFKPNQNHEVPSRGGSEKTVVPAKTGATFQKDNNRGLAAANRQEKTKSDIGPAIKEVDTRDKEEMNLPPRNTNDIAMGIEEKGKENKTRGSIAEETGIEVEKRGGYLVAHRSKSNPKDPKTSKKSIVSPITTTKPDTQPGNEKESVKAGNTARPQKAQQEEVGTKKSEQISVEGIRQAAKATELLKKKAGSSKLDESVGGASNHIKVSGTKRVTAADEAGIEVEKRGGWLFARKSKSKATKKHAEVQRNGKELKMYIISNSGETSGSQHSKQSDRSKVSDTTRTSVADESAVEIEQRGEWLHTSIAGKQHEDSSRSNHIPKRPAKGSTHADTTKPKARKLPQVDVKLETRKQLDTAVQGTKVSQHKPENSAQSTEGKADNLQVSDMTKGVVAEQAAIEVQKRGVLTGGVATGGPTKKGQGQRKKKLEDSNLNTTTTSVSKSKARKVDDDKASNSLRGAITVVRTIEQENRGSSLVAYKSATTELSDTSAKRAEHNDVRAIRQNTSDILQDIVLEETKSEAVREARAHHRNRTDKTSEATLKPSDILKEIKQEETQRRRYKTSDITRGGISKEQQIEIESRGSWLLAHKYLSPKHKSWRKLKGTEPTAESPSVKRVKGKEIKFSRLKVSEIAQDCTADEAEIEVDQRKGWFRLRKNRDKKKMQPDGISCVSPPKGKACGGYAPSGATLHNSGLHQMLIANNLRDDEQDQRDTSDGTRQGHLTKQNPSGLSPTNSKDSEVLGGGNSIVASSSSHVVARQILLEDEEFDVSCKAFGKDTAFDIRNLIGRTRDEPVKPTNGDIRGDEVLNVYSSVNNKEDALKTLLQSSDDFDIFCKPFGNDTAFDFKHVLGSKQGITANQLEAGILQNKENPMIERMSSDDRALMALDEAQPDEFDVSCQAFGKDTAFDISKLVGIRQERITANTQRDNVSSNDDVVNSKIERFNSEDRALMALAERDELDVSWQAFGRDAAFDISNLVGFSQDRRSVMKKHSDKAPANDDKASPVIERFNSEDRALMAMAEQSEEFDVSCQAFGKDTVLDIRNIVGYREDGISIQQDTISNGFASSMIEHFSSEDRALMALAEEQEEFDVSCKAFGKDTALDVRNLVKFSE